MPRHDEAAATDAARARIAHLSRALERFSTAPPRPEPAWDPVENGEAEREAEADERLRIELAIVRAALKTERQQTIDLKSEVEQLTAMVELERQRLESLRADRDRWAARAEMLALPIFQERESHADEDRREEPVRPLREGRYRQAA